MFPKKSKRECKHNQGKEWWSARPFSMHSISHRSKTNKWFKRATHKIERREVNFNVLG